VQALLTDTTCGQGALDAPGLWDFTVKLSKHRECLYWNNGAESICGTMSSNDMAFSFKSESAETLTESGPGRPGCVVWRQDTVSGLWTNQPKPAGQSETEPSKNEFIAFTGKISYAFAPGIGSQCDEALDAYGLPPLPCLTRYDMTAEKIDE